MYKSRQENHGCAFVAVLRFIDMRDKVLTHVKKSMLEHFKECLLKLLHKNYIYVIIICDPLCENPAKVISL